mgnify:CR=1 FL=1
MLLHKAKFAWLGDVRVMAITRVSIAEAWSQQNKFDEAIRLCREEILPAFKCSRAKRKAACSRANLPRIFLCRRERRNIRRAEEFLSEAFPLAEEMKIPEAEEFRKMIKVCERLTNQSRRYFSTAAQKSPTISSLARVESCSRIVCEVLRLRKWTEPSVIRK